MLWLIPFDPAKAKELVQKSGYDGKPIKIMIDTGNASPRARWRPFFNRAGMLSVSRVRSSSSMLALLDDVN